MRVYRLASQNDAYTEWLGPSGGHACGPDSATLQRLVCTDTVAEGKGDAGHSGWLHRTQIPDMRDEKRVKGLSEEWSSLIWSLHWTNQQIVKPLLHFFSESQRTVRASLSGFLFFFPPFFLCFFFTAPITRTLCPKISTENNIRTLYCNIYTHLLICTCVWIISRALLLFYFCD